MCDAIILSFSVHYRCPRLLATEMFSNKVARNNATHVWPREKTRIKLIVLSFSEAKEHTVLLHFV
jgi:hypothetical protein